MVRNTFKCILKYCTPKTPNSHSYIMYEVWFTSPPPDIQRQVCRRMNLSHKAHRFSTAATINNNLPLPLFKFVHLAIGGIQLELDNCIVSALHYLSSPLPSRRHRLIVVWGTSVERSYIHPLISLNVLQWAVVLLHRLIKSEAVLYCFSLRINAANLAMVSLME